jgi:hypothetical protein
MRYFTLLIVVLVTACSPKTITDAGVSKSVEPLITPFEQNNNTTATYDEVIAFYKTLESYYPEFITMTEVGQSDIGKPIHTIVVSNTGANTPEKVKAQGKVTLFINNGIHPGEPCGVDATMMMVRDFMEKPALHAKLDKVTLVIIPMYNIGGALNRSGTSRANQNGPEAYGFRGNAQNLDLNRDFVKCDTKNALTFNDVFTKWMPNILIDNHTSNGADYQYTMTLIATQHSKLPKPLAAIMNDEMLPYLYDDMDKKGWEMTPYVYARNTPEDGITGFLDLPRYSSGYAALFNCLSFMPETHMLKPFEDRVVSTYAFMNSMIDFINEKGAELRQAKAAADAVIIEQRDFDLNWNLDLTKVDTILFKGYEAKYKPSDISGLNRLYYDRNEPYEKPISYLNHYTPALAITRPDVYIVPQSAWKVVTRLQNNKVKMTRLEADTFFDVEMYYIEDYKTVKQPYEGHYLHSNVEVKKVNQRVQFYAGDYWIDLNQAQNRYIIETLEPQAPDSYFAWNFFDGVLQRKEYFSAYVFEDTAVKILENNPTLKAELEAKKAADKDFANSAYAQLFFIYERSEWSEKTFNRYPIGRFFYK